MASHNKIKQDLISSTLFDREQTLVGASLFTGDDGSPYHAAIFISKDGNKSIFHFDKVSLSEDKADDCRPFLIKELEQIPPFEAGAFKIFCQEALLNTAPNYQFYYDGGYFNKDAIYVSPDEDPVYSMTCVGFCLGILKGWLGVDYMEYTDWNLDNSLQEDKIKSQLAELKVIYPDINDEELKEGIRRIKPLEYLSAAFVKNTPIRKAATDKINKPLKKAVSEWHAIAFPIIAS